MPPETVLKCDVHTEQISRLAKDNDEQWTHINNVENALRKLVPIWTAVVLMVMSALTGSALTFAGMVFKFFGSKPGL